MISEEALKAMEARAEEATPGPWISLEISTGVLMVYGGDEIAALKTPDVLVGSSDVESYSAGIRKDYAFLTEARRDVPDLIVELRRQRARIADLEARRRELRERLAALREGEP